MAATTWFLSLGSAATAGESEQPASAWFLSLGSAATAGKLGVCTTSVGGEATKQQIGKPLPALVLGVAVCDRTTKICNNDAAAAAEAGGDAEAAASAAAKALPTRESPNGFGNAPPWLGMLSPL